MTEEDTSGIPTRAIHEAYLDMQRALKQYRQAKDAGSGKGLGQAHGEVQESVITFYEMLRPHLRDNDSVSKYWDGRPPTYNGTQEAPDHREGWGILHVQQRTDKVQLNGENPDELETFREWHQALELPDSCRLRGIMVNDGIVLVSYDAYQMGLKELDAWETKYKEETTSKGGFMGNSKQTTMRKERVDMTRLKRAARELSAAAKDMGFLSDTKTPTNDDTLPV